LVLSTFSTSSEAFKDLLEKSRNNSEEQDKGMSKIYIMGNWRWMVAVSKPARSFNSVVLDGDLSTKIYSDASQFFESKNWYYQNGVPYRRVSPRNYSFSFRVICYMGILVVGKLLLFLHSLGNFL
jgi:hypothetical protein